MSYTTIYQDWLHWVYLAKIVNAELGRRRSITDDVFTFPQVMPSVPESTNSHAEAGMHNLSDQASPHTHPYEPEFRFRPARSFCSHCPLPVAAPSCSFRGEAMLSSSNDYVECSELDVKRILTATKAFHIRYLLQTDRARKAEASNGLHKIPHIKRFVCPQVSWRGLPARLDRAVALTRPRLDSGI